MKDLQKQSLEESCSLSENMETIRFGPFILTPARREISENGVPIQLGGRAMDILLILLANAGKVLSKESLISAAWPSSIVSDGTLRVQVANLRKALGDGVAGRRYIANIPQRGYCFVAPISSAKTDATKAIGTPANPTREVIAYRTPRLIGRDEVVRSTSALLSSRRFVTLVGPGGIGKTSVALAVAELRNSGYAHGSRLIDLDTINNASLVPSAIASRFGLSILSNDPTQHIIAFLKDKQLILLLDNCEHVIDAVARIAEEIVKSAPNVEILATSREPLQARGEWVQRLAPLDIPSPDMHLTADDAMSFSAIDLFVERAQAGMDSFTFRDDDVAHIVQICRRVDGLPLAIELAARRVGLFGLRVLAAMLDDKLSMITNGYRTALPRHKTLSATLDWSYSLLTKTEQAILCCLSVFRESFSLNSAIGIAKGVGIDAVDATEAMANLVDKSLVVAMQGLRGVSHRLLNTTRNYASSKLKEFSFEAQVPRQHALLMKNILRGIEEEFRTNKVGLTDWYHENNRRIDDIRAALEWSFSDAGDNMLGADIVLASAPIWFQLLLLNEYLAWLNVALELGPTFSQNPHKRIRLTLALGNAYLYTRGPQPDAFQVFSKTNRLAAELKDRLVELRATWAVYYCFIMTSDYQDSLVEAQRYGALAQETPDALARLTFHRMIGLSYHLNGNQELARLHAAKALEPLSTENPILLGGAYQIHHYTAASAQYARILWIQGFPDQAIRLTAEAVQEIENTNHALSLAYALVFIACPIALWAGDLALAESYLRKLQSCTAEHSLQYWHGWANIHAISLEKKKNDIAAIHDIKYEQLFDDTLIDEYLVDTIATMDSCFVGNKVIARTDKGLNGWCAAEVYRAQGEHALSKGRPGEEMAEGLFRHSIKLAKEQGAHFWQLRAASSLARLLQSQGKHNEARDILTDALAKYSSNDTILDVQNGRRQLSLLNAVDT